MRDLYDRFKEPGEHQRMAEVVGGWMFAGIFHGCWTRDERFGPAHRKRRKARQVEKKSAGEASGERGDQSSDLSPSSLSL
jgi:hypothetical protein